MAMNKWLKMWGDMTKGWPMTNAGKHCNGGYVREADVPCPLCRAMPGDDCRAKFGPASSSKPEDR